jgi:hypothetical protein
MYIYIFHWTTKFNFFWRGELSTPNRTFNAEFKYVSGFFSITHSFLVTAKLYVQYWSATLY